MPKFHRQVHVAASPDDVWRVVADLEAAPAWVPGVTSAGTRNLERVCRLADGAEIRERVLEFSESERRLRVQHTQQPAPVRDSFATITVTADGEGSTVTMQNEFEVLDPAMEEELSRMIDGGYEMALQELARLVES